MMPQYPAIVIRSALLYTFPKAKRMNNRARLPNTNPSAFDDLSAIGKSTNVNTPHRNKYAAIEAESAALPRPSAGNRTIITKDNQKAPYEKKARAPKLLPFFHSINPTMICAIPP